MGATAFQKRRRELQRFINEQVRPQEEQPIVEAAEQDDVEQIEEKPKRGRKK